MLQVLDLLELESQAVVNFLRLVLKPKPRTSTKTVSTVNCLAVSSPISLKTYKQL